MCGIIPEITRLWNPEFYQVPYLTYKKKIYIFHSRFTQQPLSSPPVVKRWHTSVCFDNVQIYAHPEVYHKIKNTVFYLTFLRYRFFSVSTLMTSIYEWYIPVNDDWQ